MNFHDMQTACEIFLSQEILEANERDLWIKKCLRYHILTNSLTVVYVA